MDAFGNYGNTESTYGVFRFRAEDPQTPVDDVILFPEPIFNELRRRVAPSSERFHRLRPIVSDEYRDHYVWPAGLSELVSEIRRAICTLELTEIDSDLEQVAEYCEHARRAGLGVVFSGN